MERDERHIKLVGPTILIGIGVILLLNNLGYLDWSFWDILSLWPILLIAAGLEILVGRKSAAGAILSAFVVLGLIVGGVWLVGTGNSARTAAQTTTISEPRDGMTTAQVTLAPAVAQVSIKALNDSGNFVEGTIGQRRSERLVQNFTGGTPARLVLKTSGISRGIVGPGKRYSWDLAFHPDVALDLGIDIGVGDINLDLSALTVDTANINFGVGDILVKLPQTGDCDINIDGGVGAVVIEVPAGTALRVEADAAIVARTLPPDYTRVNNRYTSPGYSSAEKRVNIHIGLGVGSLTIQEMP
ncbi:MAG TPA: DUF5668 domain-containing protein [Anaerolineae bacterium]|nr:DUF5668 domain-containing protein [Anaerolineae bacterium]HQI84737.1 DUF5668 domain-containing protein [Anaerolineae bacterium]